MFKIIKKRQLNPEIFLLEFAARDIALAAEPGQFLIFRVDKTGERFPLTLYDWNKTQGTVTVVCQAVGVSTKKLCALNEGESVLDIVGPLGHASKMEKLGKVICIGGGVGTAEAYPIARAMKNAGNDVTAIIGARTAELILCENEMREFCDQVYIATDDGSRGKKGFVTDVLRELLDSGPYNLIFAIGPVIMMKAVSEVTRPYAVKTLVSLNAIMIDGTGMCGGCRIRYEGNPRFTCVDGPEFDAHLVDFEDLIQRQGRYKDKEKSAMDHHDEACRIGLGKTKK